MTALTVGGLYTITAWHIITNCNKPEHLKRGSVFQYQGYANITYSKTGMKFRANVSASDPRFLFIHVSQPNKARSCCFREKQCANYQYKEACPESWAAPF
ncbi:hypothetical protein SLA2020_294060 [Shorea laevis]